MATIKGQVIYWIVEQLVPEYLAVLPIDPMDGRPLRYARTEGDRFRIWSVGSDGQDNGGEIRPRELDWVWP